MDSHSSRSVENTKVTGGEVHEVFLALNRLTRRSQQKLWRSTGQWAFAIGLAVLFINLAQGLIRQHWSSTGSAPTSPSFILLAAGFLFSPLAITMYAVAWSIAGYAVAKEVEKYEEIRTAVPPATLQQAVFLLMLKQGVIPLTMILLIALTSRSGFSMQEHLVMVVAPTLWAFVLFILEVRLAYCLIWLAAFAWLPFTLEFLRHLLALANQLSQSHVIRAGNMIHAEWLSAGILGFALLVLFFIAVKRRNSQQIKSLMLLLSVCAVLSAWKASFLPFEAPSVEALLPGETAYNLRVFASYFAEVGSSIGGPLVRVADGPGRSVNVSLSFLPIGGNMSQAIVPVAVLANLAYLGVIIWLQRALLALPKRHGSV